MTYAHGAIFFAFASAITGSWALLGIAVIFIALSLYFDL